MSKRSLVFAGIGGVALLAATGVAITLNMLGRRIVKTLDDIDWDDALAKSGATTRV